MRDYLWTRSLTNPAGRLPSSGEKKVLGKPMIMGIFGQDAKGKRV
jgi:hypothetical protein